MLKHSADGLSHSFAVQRRQGASYTGGSLCVVNARTLACLCSDRVALLDIGTGLVREVIPAPEAGVAHEPIVSFSVSPGGAHLYTFGRAQLCRVWALGAAAASCVRQWKCHRAPVQVSASDSSGALLASGGSDRVVLVHDVDGGFATHSFKGGHEGLVTALAFQPHPVTVQRLVSGGSEGAVCVWDLLTQACVAKLTEHTAAVTCLLFSPDVGGHTLLTGGRDKVLNVWDLRAVEGGAGGARGAAAAAHKGATPVFEGLEGAVVLPEGAVGAWGGVPPPSPQHLRFAVAGVGDRGMVRVWACGVTSTSKGDRTVALSCIASTSATALCERGAEFVHHTSSGGAGGEGGSEGGSLWKPSTSAPLCGGADALPPPDMELPLSSQYSRILLLPGMHTLAAEEAGASTTSSAAPGKKRRGSSSSSSLQSFRAVVVTNDQTLSFLDFPTLTLVKSVAGYNDAFTDARYLPGGLHRLVASTNSEQLRIIDTRTMDTRLCTGHTAAVLSVGASPDGTLAASASKDGTARIWDVQTALCVGLCEGHTESLTAVAFPTRLAGWGSKQAASAGGGAAPAPSQWLVTASRDRTLKLWQLAPLLALLPHPRPEHWSPSLLKSTIASSGLASIRGKGLSATPLLRPKTLGTAVAHEKDINAIAVSPNDRMLASASQDRCIKLWGLPSLSPIAVLKGHKRGVWGITFSPTEQILASASGDATLRLWSVSPATGFACLRTFEGHSGPVLSLAFLPHGQQLVSGGGDGVLKLWNIKDSECMGSFDAHGDKLWCVSVRPPPSGSGAAAAMQQPPLELVTGGGDSILNVWVDSTASEAAGEVAIAEAAVRKQQDLLEAMATRKYGKAIGLTLELEQPGRCGDILSELLEVGPTPPSAGQGAGVLAQRFRAAMVGDVKAMRSLRLGVVGGEGAVVAGAAAGAAAAPGPAPASTPPLLLEHTNAEGVGMIGEVLRSLPSAHLVRLLSYIREWNTRSRNGLLAQRLLHIVLRTFTQQHLEAAFQAARAESQGRVERLIPGVGTQSMGAEEGALRHASGLSRLDRLVGAEAAEAEAAEDALLGGDASAAGPGKGRASATAAAELRAFIAATLPYTQRHYDRLDRLFQTAHIADYLLEASGALTALGSDGGGGGGQAEALARLTGKEAGGGGFAPAPFSGSSRDSMVSEEYEQEDGEEEEEGRGGGWAHLLRRG
jgi:U3 small nucleolar RNA-associated protein 13